MFGRHMAIDHEQTFASFETAANSTDFDQVEPLIAADAIYWFTDGSFHGIDEIREAFEATWETIRGETYQIEDLRWIAVSETVAVCVYRFRSQGSIDGRPFAATGRGTNVLVNRDGAWTIVHEHLSNAPRP